MNIPRKLIAQFRRPSGLLGSIAGLIMAKRPSNRMRNEWTVSLLALPRNALVFEWGCGPGLGTAAVIQRFPDARVVAADHSELMVRTASRRNAEAIANGQVEIIAGSLAIATANAPLDAIFSCNVLQFSADLKGAISSMYAALKEGGCAASTYQPRLGGG